MFCALMTRCHYCHLQICFRLLSSDWRAAFICQTKVPAWQPVQPNQDLLATRQREPGVLVQAPGRMQGYGGSTECRTQNHCFRCCKIVEPLPSRTGGSVLDHIPRSRGGCRPCQKENGREDMEVLYKRFTDYMIPRSPDLMV